ncbi:MAG TPA: T9SS type A sorting domain-containing protein [Ferruginibacter sp.]|nr:T9SS type A sorting domain-containing protein [Ferruginibacter sp.]HMP19459.1 T9SS type A sorting domain-containing protein [Ferruginibacter sp.]
MKQFIISITVLFFISANSFATDNGKRSENYNLGGSRKGLILLPDAATGNAQLLFATAKEGKALVQVFDANGKLVLQQEEQLSTGKNKIQVNHFNELAEGNYSITLTVANRQYNTSFLVWK